MLLRECMSSDFLDETFTALYQSHRIRIYEYCVRRLGEAHGAEVAQDVFCTAWEGRRKRPPDAPSEAWLLGIARNKCKQVIRNWARRRDIANWFRDDFRQ